MGLPQAQRLANWTSNQKNSDHLCNSRLLSNSRLPNSRLANSRLVHRIERQLAEYGRAEFTSDAAHYKPATAS